MKNFRSYQLSVTFYQMVKTLKLPRHLKDQLLRAASSIALNLAEGRGKRTTTDQRRYFYNAFGSIRECQAIFDLHSDCHTSEISEHLDHLAACVYKLIQRAH